MKIHRLPKIEILKIDITLHTQIVKYEPFAALTWPGSSLMLQSLQISMGVHG